MNVLMLGVISALDVLANAFVFSGALRSSFDVAEAADFSTALGWAVVLAALTFGGAEQMIDHRRAMPTNMAGSPGKAAWLWISAATALMVLSTSGEAGNALRVEATLLLAAVLGLRSVGRAIAFARGRYRREALISAFELALLIALTRAEFSILSSYLYSKLAGLSLRITLFPGFAELRMDASYMRSYSFAALAPALYFNIYYTVLPVLVTPEVVVRFRLLQSLLVPMSFLGSLLARARIIFRTAPDLLMRLLDLPKRSQRAPAFVASALLPCVLSFIYIVAIALFIEPLHAFEIMCTVIYCSLIYHRAQLYSLITLQLGPVVRARVALGGVVLVVLSFFPIAMVDDPSIALLYTLLVIVELTLLAVSVFLLGRKLPVPI